MLFPSVGGGSPIQEMGLEILNGNFRCVPLVAARRDKFHCHLVFVLDDYFHGFRHLVVTDVFRWYYSSLLQACHQHSICPGKFVVVSASDGFDQDCIDVYFDHDQYVFVAAL